MTSRYTLARILIATLGCLAIATAAAVSPAVAAVNVIISGTVVDLSGAPVSGVQVGTEHSASRDTTDADGHFSFPTETTGVDVGVDDKTRMTLITDYTQPGFVSMRTQPISISGNLNVDTVTLPNLPTKTVRVVDSAGTPVYQASVSSAHYLNDGWADAGHHLTPSLAVADATFQLTASTNAAGEIRALFPVMSDGKLPATPVEVHSGDSVYTANLTDAVGTNPHVVTISGYTVGPPTAPTSVTASASFIAGGASVDWGQAVHNGSAVTGYTVTATPGGAIRQVPADQTYTTFTGLTGVSHTFTVIAHSTAGSVTSSPSNAVVPPSLPSTPPDLLATNTGPGQVTVTWGPSSGNGEPLNGYWFEFAGTPGDTFRYPDQRSVVLDHLAVGSHSLRVWAMNRYGNSAPATITFDVPTAAASPTTATATVPDPSLLPTAATAPNRMQAPKVVIRGTKLIVKWRAAVSDGSTITRYLIDISKGKDKTAKAGARKTVFTRLKPGRYRIRIAARNVVGTSPYSAWVKIQVR